MATLANTGTKASTTAATKIIVSSPNATVGNTLIFQIGWVDSTGNAVTPTTPTNWSDGYKKLSAAIGDNSGCAGYSLFYKTASGGIENATFNNPGAGASLYGTGIITEWSGMGVLDSASTGAEITNSTAASTTGMTVPNTGTLTNPNSTAFTGVGILSGTGTANANIAFNGGSWNALFSSQNTATEEGSLAGDKVVAANSPIGAVYTWSADSSMHCFQGAVTVFSDANAVQNGGYYLQEDNLSKFTLEDGSGFYLIESWSTSSALSQPPFVYGDLNGIGGPGRFFKDLTS